MPARNNVSAPGATNITDITGTFAAGVATTPPVTGTDMALQVHADLGSAVVAVAQELQGAANFATGQAAVSTVTQLLAARPTRRSAIVSNPSATIAIYVGGASVSSTTGQIIPPGNSLTIPFTGAIYAVAATGTITVTFAEAYD